MNTKLFYLTAILFLILLGSCSFNGVADSQNESRALIIQKQTTSTNRTALVIGNSRYKVSPLKNPVNDAKEIATTLKSLGFNVLKGLDASQNKMKKLITTFGNEIEKGGTGLFFYAGHGMQVNGRNYLIPVGASIQSEEEVEYESVDTGRVLAQMAKAGNGMNIMILDACRDNPFARSFRSGVKGLAHMDAPGGTIIAYSTAPGQVAADGAGKNSVFTSELVKNMKKPGIKIEDVFKKVRKQVRTSTGNRQTPWESSSLEGDFYFNRSQAPAVTSIEPERMTESVVAKAPTTVKPPSIEGFWKKEGRKKLIIKIVGTTGIIVKAGDKVSLSGKKMIKNIRREGSGFSADRAVFKYGKIVAWIKTTLVLKDDVLMETNSYMKGKKLFFSKMSPASM